MDLMSEQMAILIESDGEITTPNFVGLAEPDHPGGRLWHVRDLIDSADPRGLKVPGTVELVAWLDERAHVRRLSANMVASFAFADAFDLPLQVICGPLLITGGSPDEPLALTFAQVAEAFEHLGLEADDESAED